MKKSILSIILISLMAVLVTACSAGREVPEYYQSAIFTSEGKVIKADLNVIVGNSVETISMDSLVSSLDDSKVEIYNMKIGDTIKIDFKDNPPDQLKIMDVLMIKDDGKTMSEESTKDASLDNQGNKYEFTIDEHKTVLAPSEVSVNAVEIRGYCIVATLGETNYVYSFLFNTDND